MKTKLRFFVVLFCFFMTSIYGQQTILSSGGNATGIGGQSSYSVGQIAYTSITGSNGSVNQGVQQPFEIFLLGADLFPDIKLLMVYPNPTKGIVTLITGNYLSENLTYQLFDLNGRQIANQKITQTETQIHLEKEAATLYFLKVLDHDELLKTFKIIKNN
jgi:hypothetical protein